MDAPRKTIWSGRYAIGSGVAVALLLCGAVAALRADSRTAGLVFAIPAACWFLYAFTAVAANPARRDR